MGGSYEFPTSQLCGPQREQGNLRWIGLKKVVEKIT